MMEHRADNYECVHRYPILKGYLEHFNQVSKNNEIPGLLSFFFIQGQAAIPYVRIPVGGSNLDPRVSMFWIQGTRTGKSAAYQVIEQVLKGAGLQSTDYASGNDAALVGTLVDDPESEDRRNPDQIVRAGLLAGRKGLNFDEGSILLKTGQHNENTTLFLQTALNSSGTGRNILVKHMARDTFEIKSEVSLWITTYPPNGIKEHVLDKGIFQRVLTYWRHWTLEMKREIAHELADAVHSKPDFTMSFEKVKEHFINIQKSLKQRVFKLTGLNDMEWNDMNEEDQDSTVLAIMDDLFTVHPSFHPALHLAIDDYYDSIEDMDPQKQGVCASFIMGLQNYTNVLAHHMAMIEGVWVVTGEHVDMAKEILYDLYQNLIHWLESEVKVGMIGKEKQKLEGAWKEAFKRCEKFDFDDNRGVGWVRKSSMMKQFGVIANLSSDSAINNKYNSFGAKVFEETNEGVRKYARLRADYRDNKKA